MSDNMESYRPRQKSHSGAFILILFLLILVVGASLFLLLRRTKKSEEAELPQETIVEGEGISYEHMSLIPSTPVVYAQTVAPADEPQTEESGPAPSGSVDLAEIPAWDGETPYVYFDGTSWQKPAVWDPSDYGSDSSELNISPEDLNVGLPFFSDEDITRAATEIWEEYSELDSLGRCGVAYATVCRELMPTEERGPIDNVRPSGWNQAKYPGLIEGNFYQNRCHLIGFQLCGENDNPLNLFSGTRYLNIQGMLSHENEIREYVRMTGDHVLYRVTPIFAGDDLMATGVLMEGLSVGDGGSGIRFCTFAYNEQPGLLVDHFDGASRLTG